MGKHYVHLSKTVKNFQHVLLGTSFALIHYNFELQITFVAQHKTSAKTIFTQIYRQWCFHILEQNIVQVYISGYFQGLIFIQKLKGWLNYI